MKYWTNVEELKKTKVITKTEKRKGREIAYVNSPAAYDIEASSFTAPDGRKLAVTYIWMFGWGDHIYFGRTWEEFFSFLRRVSDILDLGDDRRLIAYVHNLSYEWGFIQRQTRFREVFFRDIREPLRCYMPDYGIELRDSYALTNKSLAASIKSLPIEYRSGAEKAVGELDYRLIRHPRTPLTDRELYYCEQDIRGLLSVVRYEQSRATWGHLFRVPMTATGKTRTHVKNSTFRGDDGWRYKDLMRELTIEPTEYQHLKEAFSGGAVHASWRYSGETVEGVSSKDVASMYPYQMVARKYPMGKGKYIAAPTPKQLKYHLKESVCVFRLDLTGVSSVPGAPDHPLSESHCQSLSAGAVIDNGRVVSANFLSTRCTNLDFSTYSQYYHYDEGKITEMWVYRADYLPTSLVECILDLYEAKTQLKDVEGREVEYQFLKELLNSVYGMTVSDVVRDFIEWDEEAGLKIKKPMSDDIEEIIEKHNANLGRFLFYPWGVWTTALSRRTLYSVIWELGDDYVYSDTDSAKYRGDHDALFERLNLQVLKRLSKVARHHGIDPDRFAPSDIKGRRHPIGVWEDDGCFRRFKSLGAKRYLREYEDGTLKLTSAGTKTRRKDEKDRTALDYMVETAQRTEQDVFDVFDFGLTIPPEYSGRTCAHYNDGFFKILQDGQYLCFWEDCSFAVPLTDYQGNTMTVEEKTCIHIEETAYRYEQSDAYRAFLEYARSGAPETAAALVL